MSKKVRVTPEIIQTVKEINDSHPEWWYWEIGQLVGVCDDTVMRILHNEYRIEGDKVVRIYKKPKKTNNKVKLAKQFLNALYGSAAFSINLNDICEGVGHVREALTDLSNSLK